MVDKLGDGGQVVANLNSGTTTYIRGAALDENNNLYYKVAYLSGDGDVVGYVNAENLAYNDPDILDWEAKYNLK